MVNNRENLTEYRS